jgi:hypothetical protein
MSTNNRHTDEHAIESRLATRLAGVLSARVDDMPRDIAERLRFGREQAVARAQQMRVAAPASVVGVSSRGAALLGGFVPWWQRAASALPVLALLAGLVMIDRLTVREQVLAAADIDAQLLADDLPPAAYSDPGFAEYLRTAPPP